MNAVLKQNKTITVYSMSNWPVACGYNARLQCQANVGIWSTLLRINKPSICLYLQKEKSHNQFFFLVFYSIGTSLFISIVSHAWWFAHVFFVCVLFCYLSMAFRTCRFRTDIYDNITLYTYEGSLKKKLEGKQR